MASSSIRRLARGRSSQLPPAKLSEGLSLYNREEFSLAMRALVETAGRKGRPNVSAGAPCEGEVFKKAASTSRRPEIRKVEEDTRKKHSVGFGDPHSLELEWVPGYEKMSSKPLGRGGSAVVWLARCLSSGEAVAVKQIRMERPSIVGDSPLMNEVELAGRLFNSDGLPKFNETRWPGYKHIARFYGVTIGKSSTFIVQEFGGEKNDPSFRKELQQHTCRIKLDVSAVHAMRKRRVFAERGVRTWRLIRSVKGEFINCRRVYRVEEKPLYVQMKSNPQILKTILRHVLEVIDLLNHVNYVHADLKPDNILVKRVDGERNCVEIRVIDFGCAYEHHDKGAAVMATPEYMPPEALDYLGNMADNNARATSIDSPPWAFDIWSLGVIFLELLIGIPPGFQWDLVIKDKCGNDRHLPGGFFAGHGKGSDVIRRKQLDVAQHLAAIVMGSPTGLHLRDPTTAINLLSRMLQKEPSNRISPREALSHPFLHENIGNH